METTPSTLSPLQELAGEVGKHLRTYGVGRAKSVATPCARGDWSQTFTSLRTEIVRGVLTKPRTGTGGFARALDALITYCAANGDESLAHALLTYLAESGGEPQFGHGLPATTPWGHAVVTACLKSSAVPQDVVDALTTKAMLRGEQNVLNVLAARGYAPSIAAEQEICAAAAKRAPLMMWTDYATHVLAWQDVWARTRGEAVDLACEDVARQLSKSLQGVVDAESLDLLVDAARGGRWMYLFAIAWEARPLAKWIDDKDRGRGWLPVFECLGEHAMAGDRGLVRCLTLFLAHKPPFRTTDSRMDSIFASLVPQMTQLEATTLDTVIAELCSREAIHLALRMAESGITPSLGTEQLLMSHHKRRLVEPLVPIWRAVRLRGELKTISKPAAASRPLATLHGGL